ncbi:MAG TPA: TonB-dependent receptor [Gammaproteobacteria bacterium]
MRVNRLYAAVAGVMAGAGGLATQPALAQNGSSALEEIVVTATRREANLQDVPISIVAVTGDNLEIRGLDTVEELSQAIPNVVATGGGGGTAGTGFSVRGIPNVGVYVDGIWQIDTAGTLVREFVDIDRIEVLRGPQGTTFGRDSTGGAIRLWTKRPSDEFGADVSVTTGSYNRRDVKLSADVPLTDTLRTKWTGASLYREGYIQNLTTGEKDGGVDQNVFRGDILWLPTDNLSLRFNYMNVENVFTEPKVIDAIYRTFADPGINDVIGLPEFYGTVPGLEPFNAQNNQSGFPGGKVGKWENRSNVRLPNEMDVEQMMLDISLQITDNLSVQFLTGYTNQFNKLSNDWDASQYDIVYDLNLQDNDLFSQEIQFSGDVGRFRWVGGVYYWEESSHRRETRNVVSEFLNGVYDLNYVLNSPLCTAPVPQGFRSCDQIIFNADTGDRSQGPVQLARNGYDRIPHTERDGYAVFGEATVALTDTLDLSFGLRYHEENIFSEQLDPLPGVTAPRPLVSNQWHVGGDPFAGVEATVGPGVPWEHTYDKVTSRLSLQKQFSDDIMGYISYAEGFNSGGVATPTIQGQRQLIPYDPQTIETIEVGLRSDLAGGRVRLNATLFDTDWKDFQSAGVVYDAQGRQVPQLQTTNVGDAAAKGVEFELTFLATQNFMINFNLGLLDTEYTDLPPNQRSGHLPWTTETEFPRAPDTSYSLGLQHTADLQNGGTWTTRLDYMYQDQFWRFEPFLRMDAYPSIPPGHDESGDWGVVNMRFTYAPAQADWQFSLFGTNLTDEYMINSGFFHGIWGFDFATVARPREVGATFEFRF